jgi:phosphate-selective porin
VNSSDRARNLACAGAFIVTLAVPAGVLAQTTSEEQTTSKETSTQDGEAGVFRMGNSPSLRLGNQVRIDLRARVQADVSLQEESGAAGDRFAWGNRRIGVDGVLFKRVEFQIERELSDVEPWRDVFADVRVHRALRIRAGHFKVPFSMERTTSVFDLDFIARAASVTDISPGRETGIMLHGRGPRRFFEYEFGVFRLAQPPLQPFVESGTDGAMLTAARFTFTPGTATIGIAFTESGLPEGFHGSSGHFDDDGLLSSEDFYVNGRRRRLGVEGRWTAGRLSIKGELLRQADSREGQSVSNSDLSDLIVDGGYVSGVWRIVGSPRRSRRAVDAAVRFERLGFHSADRSDAPSLGPRADHIAPLRQDGWTFGGTWLVNRWVKVQVNAIRESFVDETGIRPEIPQARWRSLMRLQFAM